MEKSESYLTAPNFEYRGRKDKDKDEDPFARSDRGLKKKHGKLSKDAEPTTEPKKERFNVWLFQRHDIIKEVKQETDIQEKEQKESQKQTNPSTGRKGPNQVEETDIQEKEQKESQKQANPSTEWKGQSQKSSQVKKIQLEGLKLPKPQDVLQKRKTRVKVANRVDIAFNACALVLKLVVYDNNIDINNKFLRILLTSPIVTRADNRTNGRIAPSPTRGYCGCHVVPLNRSKQFEIKQGGNFLDKRPAEDAQASYREEQVQSSSLNNTVAKTPESKAIIAKVTYKHSPPE
ncbi:hypothetical protein Tco_0494737 [Tanacetum coccineum]